MNHIADLQWFVPSAFLSRAAKKHRRLATIHLVDSCVRFDLVRVAVHRIAAPAHIIARRGVCFRMFILPDSDDLTRFWVCLGFFCGRYCGENNKTKNESSKQINRWLAACFAITHWQTPLTAPASRFPRQGTPSS